MSRSFELGRLVCTRINVANALCISTLALRVSTPDSTASDVALEKRVGREMLSAQSKAKGSDLTSFTSSFPLILVVSPLTGLFPFFMENLSEDDGESSSPR
jgi:hypothetical protein